MMSIEQQKQQEEKAYNEKVDNKTLHLNRAERRKLARSKKKIKIKKY